MNGQAIIEKNMSTLERSYFNSLKGLLIILVVIGHFGQTISNLLPGTMGNVAHGVILFIYLFHMPLFMFVSGYLSKNLEKRRDRAFEELLIPYILFQIFVGVGYLLLTHSPKAISNIFIPQMGAWYLISLFTYRILMPNLSKVRGILWISILVNIFSCLSNNIGTVIALNKSLGFFTFFLFGYYVKFEYIVALKKRINRRFAFGALLLMIIVTITLTSKLEYGLCLSVLSRVANVTSFDNWYTAVAIYFAVFILTVIAGIFVMVVLPERGKLFERFGKDTMPMYLSHLVVFMACGFIVNKGNWVMAIAISTVVMVGCLVVFSTDLYEKAFNCVLFTSKNVILKKQYLSDLEKKKS